MNPIPCSHCGNNFMRQTMDLEAPKLCNNCCVREQIRNPTKEKFMAVVDILITCSRDEQIEIEEICINEGINFSRYFLQLHYASQEGIRLMREATNEQNYTEKEEKIDFVTDKPKGKKK